MATDFSKYALYRWRYVLGYTLVGLLLAGALLFAGLFLPGGLSTKEMDSVVTSAALSWHNPDSFAIINLPYHLLQAAIFKLFGISILTIKLPSLLLALAAALGLIMLLRRWYKPSIAVMASLIAISTSQFIFIAQQGTPDLLYIFWPIALLLLGTQITRAHKFRFLWKILFAVAAALSLYTPLSVYPLLAIALAIILHPHLRAIIRRLSKARLAIISVIFVVILTPLLYFVIQDTTMIISLLALPTTEPAVLMQNFSTLVSQYGLFWQPSNGINLTPLYGLGTSLIITIGLYRLVRTRQTTRSYLIIIWLLCLLPVLLLNPTLSAVTFVPSVLILAAGLTSLIGYWYRLFPHNPYARLAGLIPIAILVGTLIASGLSRYAYSYHYNPATVALFSNDLALLPPDTNKLLVSPSEEPFWSAVARFRSGLTITTTVPTTGNFVATREARTNIPDYYIYQIITNPRSSDADRLYVYQKS